MADTQNLIPEQSEQEARKKGISRSILIGLGGTGHDIVLDVRKRLIEKYGSLDRIPIIAFTVIDTDQGIKSERAGLADEPAYNKAINLDPADKIYASVTGTDALLRELPSYPHLKSWIDPAAIQGDIQLGAGAIRARGRLAFFWNFNDIAKKVEEKFNQVMLKENVDITQGNGLTLGEGVTVYLVGSLMGGTGSGMFLDAAYTVRKRIPNAQIIGIFTIPPASGAVAVDNRANAYAALLELNHYSDNGTIFTAQYARDQMPLSEEVGSKPPFTYCYLVDKEGPQTHLEINELTSMVANSIFLDLTSEFQRQKKSNRDNYSSFLTDRDELGCPQSFVSFGLSSLYFPKDKIRIACANRMARNIIEEWMTPLDRSTNIPAFSSQEWTRLGLEGLTVKDKLLFWESGNGDGSVSDAINLEWNAYDARYASDYPGHNSVADSLKALDDDINERLRDNDPNPDVLEKLDRNLGEYVRGMKRNLEAHLPEKKRALGAWVAAVVEQPAHRHGVARDVLIQWQDLLARERKNIEDATKQTRELAKGDSDLKNASLLKINENAGDLSLAMIPGAKKKAITEGKDTHLGLVRRAHQNQVEERIAAFLLKFYEELDKHINFLLVELDGYITKIRGLRDKFAEKEAGAISAESRINGEVIFEAGTPRQDPSGKVIYEGGDIDFYYRRFAGDAETFNKTQSDIRELLRLDETIYALKDLAQDKVTKTMTQRCERVFDPLEDESVLERFYRLCKDSREVAENKFKSVWSAAQPFIKIDENDAGWKLKNELKCQPTVVGTMHGNDPQTEAETQFLDLMKDQVTGLDAQHITNNAEQHQVLFIRERAAFPLRLLTGLDNYKYVYDQHIKAGHTSRPIHTRADVSHWIRIHPPTLNTQREAWETFIIGWASGCIEERTFKQSTALGTQEFTDFHIQYTDNYGFSHSETLGQWRSVNAWDASQMTFGGGRRIDSTRPPAEALDLVLRLCDSKALLDQIKRAIILKRQEIGDIAFAHALKNHYESLDAANVSLKTHTKNIIVGDPDAQPPKAGYLTRENLTEAVRQPLLQSAPTVTDITISTPVASPVAIVPITPISLPTSTKKWYYAKGGQEIGPFSQAILKAMLDENEINAQTQIIAEDGSQWLPLAQSELAYLLPNPTPIPSHSRPRPPID